MPLSESYDAPRIPDYELIRMIGRGGYGDVWLARGITGLYRAVKVVWRTRFPDSQPYEREFKGLKEFAAVSLIEPRQLALLHIGRNDAAGFFYYVMELADDAATGREIVPALYVPHTLRELRARRGRLPAGEAVTLGAEIARGLAGLHCRGLLHRDIKPSNVILVGGAPKLADIGLVASAGTALTFVGTEGYVPPEGPGAPSADVYSLGKLLYELGMGLDRTEYPRLPADFVSLPDRRELLELNEVLIRACEKKPEKRHADANELLDDLLLIIAGRSVRRLRASEKRLARAIRVAGGLALIAAIAFGLAWFEQRRAEKENALRRTVQNERDDARKAIYAAKLALSQNALAARNFGTARRLLDEIHSEPDNRAYDGFEWKALWREAQGDPADGLQIDNATLKGLQVSPDGRLMAAVGANMETTIWDATSRAEVGRCRGVFDLLGFSDDSRWLIGIDSRNRLQRWLIATGTTEEQPPNLRQRGVGVLNGKRAMSFVESTAPARPHQLRIWDFSTRTETMRIDVPSALDGRKTYFYHAAVSSDSRYCALALLVGLVEDARWHLLVYDIATGQVVFREDTPHRLSALAFEPNAPRLAVAWGDTGEVVAIDLEAETRLWSTPLGGGPNRCAGIFGHWRQTSRRRPVRSHRHTRPDQR